MYRLYVIGLNAALFGNNCTRKPHPKPKLNEAVGKGEAFWLLKRMDIRCKSVLSH